MTTDLEALVIAGYVFADEYPVPARPGRPAKVSDAELVALAVCQAAMGICSDRQFLGLVERVLPGWFPHLPEQSQYNRRLRLLVERLATVQQRLARWRDAGGARLADGTLIGVANYPGCAARSGFAGAAATATPSHSTAMSTASGSCSSPTGAACRSATRSCRRTRRSTSRSPTCSPAPRPSSSSPTRASGASPIARGSQAAARRS
jgi:hypothetical protein